MTFPIFLLLMALMLIVAYLVGCYLMPGMPATPPDDAATQAPCTDFDSKASALESIISRCAAGLLVIISIYIIAGAAGYIWQRWFA
jgi:hypothetical protein